VGYACRSLSESGLPIQSAFPCDDQICTADLVIEICGCQHKVDAGKELCICESHQPEAKTASGACPWESG
jgi:hypothetical protein